MSGAASGVLLAGTVACVAANALIVAADLARARFVLANSAEVGLRPETLPLLALLKGAGALGVLAGLGGAAPLGLTAVIGLVLFHVAAVAAHIRAAVYHNIVFPLIFLALALCALSYFTSIT